MRRLDPYFAVGLLATVVIGGTVVWKRGADSGARASKSVAHPVGDTVAAEIARLDSLDRGFTLGAAAAPIRVIEFMDFECAPCAQSHEANWDVIAKYVVDGVLRYSSYDLPMPGHVHALDAAIVASCVGEQSDTTLVEYRNALLRDQLQWVDQNVARPRLVEIAARVGADTARVNSCLQTHGLARARTLSVETARLLRQGVNYTPMLVLDGQTVPWPDLAAALTARAASLKASF